MPTQSNHGPARHSKPWLLSPVTITLVFAICEACQKIHLLQQVLTGCLAGLPVILGNNKLSKIMQKHGLATNNLNAVAFERFKTMCSTVQHNMLNSSEQRVSNEKNHRFVFLHMLTPAPETKKNTLPEINSSHLKIDSWIFLLGYPPGN